MFVGQGATRIPVRSLWLLLVYASDLLAQLRTTDRDAILAGSRDNDLLDAIAEVLVHEVELRLRRQLTAQYRTRADDLRRVRGRIDHLRTTARRLADQGRIACRYEELSVDSPRNRFIASTLLYAAPKLARRELGRRCTSAAFHMHRLGVGASAPSRTQLSADRLGHHDAADRRMLAAAHLLRDMAVPENSPGSQQLVRLRDDDAAHRTLFEKAVRGFFAHTLRHTGWQVRSPHLLWSCAAQPTPPYLPTMKTDTVLDNAADARRIVVETKFSDSLVDHHGKSIVKTAHLYQLYAYLASQTGRGDALADVAEGVLLFVKVEQREVFEGQFGIQGHRIRFLSVDLGAEPADIRQRFMRCIEPTNV